MKVVIVEIGKADGFYGMDNTVKVWDILLDWDQDHEWEDGFVSGAGTLENGRCFMLLKLGRCRL
jgi:hypothetical protein